MRPLRPIVAAAVIAAGSLSSTAVAGCGSSVRPAARHAAQRTDEAYRTAPSPAVLGRMRKAIVRLGGLKAVPPSLRRELNQARVPQPPVSLTLSPSSGPPGTRVRVLVTLRSPSIHRSSSPQLCWDGCRRGLDLAGAGRVRWISRRTFVAHITVPDAPWLEGGIDRVIPLTSGNYPLSVTCVTGAGSCLLASDPEGVARFRLEDPHPPAWCRSPSSCAPLSAWPRSAPAQVAASFGHAAIRVLASPDLASVGRITPLSTTSDGQAPIAADPTNPRIVGWCASGSIGLSVAGTRTTLPTAAAATVLAAEGAYWPAHSVPLPCADVLPLGRSTVLAAFEAQTGDGTGIFADYPVVTRDGGRTWTAVPVPQDTTAAGFGGFRTAGRLIEAVFARRVRSRAGPQLVATRPVVESSADGGRSWRRARLRCPAHGPCVTLGPFLPGDCAMGISTQFVLRSSDAGRSWRQAPTLTPGQLACGEGTLVMTGRSSALLVDALSANPIQRTTNAGASWHNIGLPLPEGANGRFALNLFAPAGITVLPDGALLLSEQGEGGWQLLQPGSGRWCEAAGAPRPLKRSQQASVLTVIGRDLWWLAYGDAPPNRPTRVLVHELPLSAVRCA